VTNLVRQIRESVLAVKAFVPRHEGEIAAFPLHLASEAADEIERLKRLLAVVSLCADRKMLGDDLYSRIYREGSADEPESPMPPAPASPR
jgi:hypothetical protein